MMNEVIVCVREWKDPETSDEVLYTIPPHMTELIQKLQARGDADEAIAIILKHGTLFKPLVIERVLY